MKLSVIIVNYNVRYFLEQCIISVQKATRAIDAEIIIVDNNSTDDSCDMVKDSFPHITLIENKENVGFSICKQPRGCNCKRRLCLYFKPRHCRCRKCIYKSATLCRFSKRFGRLRLLPYGWDRTFFTRKQKESPNTNGFCIKASWFFEKILCKCCF